MNEIASATTTAIARMPQVNIIVEHIEASKTQNPHISESDPTK